MSTNATLLPQALTTLEAAQQKLGTSGNEDKIINCINRVTTHIERVTDRKIMARNYDGFTKHAQTQIAAENPLYFDWDDFVETDQGWELYLPEFPIHRGDSTKDVTFELAYLASRDSSGETFATSNITEWVDYIVKEDEGTILFLNHPLVKSGLDYGVRMYRLKATLGYETIPHDIEALCLELLREIYRDSSNVSMERLEGWSKSYDLSKNNRYIEEVMVSYARNKLY